MESFLRRIKESFKQLCCNELEPAIYECQTFTPKGSRFSFSSSQEVPSAKCLRIPPAPFFFLSLSGGVGYPR